MNDTAAESLTQLVTFHIGTEEFGIPILSVHEIIFVPTITEIPRAPKTLVGIINLRGKLIPVFDLKMKFFDQPSQPAKRRRIIVTRAGASLIGILVDEVTEVIRVDQAQLDQLPESMTGSNDEFIDGVFKLDNRIIVVLQLDSLFTFEGANLPVEADTAV